MKDSEFFDKTQRNWDEARISTGTYNTKGYFSKEYKTKAGLEKGLRNYGYKSNNPYNGETWNYSGKQYKVNFNYNDEMNGIKKINDPIQKQIGAIKSGSTFTYHKGQRIERRPVVISGPGKRKKKCYVYVVKENVHHSLGDAKKNIK